MLYFRLNQFSSEKSRRNLWKYREILNILYSFSKPISSYSNHLVVRSLLYSNQRMGKIYIIPLLFVLLGSFSFGYPMRKDLSKQHIMIATFNQRGHWYPIREIAKELAARGKFKRVTICNFEVRNIVSYM